MKKLFENVEGNRFKLLTESVNGEEHVISGLKKVFGSDLKEISYKRVETVGLGYIKDVSTAQRVSLQEAKRIAESFGYKDDEQNAKFVKEDGEMSGYDASSFENDASMTQGKRRSDGDEENREVEIAKEIIGLTARLVNHIPEEDWARLVTPIQVLAKELLQIHGEK